MRSVLLFTVCAIGGCGAPAPRADNAKPDEPRADARTGDNRKGDNKRGDRTRDDRTHEPKDKKKDDTKDDPKNPAPPAAKPDGEWVSTFTLDNDAPTHTGTNPYFVLEPGYALVLEDGAERLTITVLNETRRVDGVECRVVEERTTEKGRLTERWRRYYIIGQRTNNVYLFGEEGEEYERGKAVPRDDSWLAGKDGAKFGLAMPGLPELGARFYLANAPDVAEDRSEILGLSETVRTPAGTFMDCLKIEETSALDPDAKEYKFYARGIGLVRDGDRKLTKYGKPDKK
jgi:hypothetical protein